MSPDEHTRKYLPGPSVCRGRQKTLSGGTSDTLTDVVVETVYLSRSLWRKCLSRASSSLLRGKIQCSLK